ncbi:helicase-related protein [Pelagibaculum spongiae]|uniref:DEAD/DEAH box helicase n=1 Tax=Pelagibaculum spongiae TaxID=2080658 RepID=A0A2V1GQT1_9GAMM|nr:helicase-related protein [Pelagibaculum spongiae]PVZ64360.1 DEAD/DEAH box helicase [Pelagibaculum spongiae]
MPSVSLPIDSVKAEFLEKISLNHLVVAAETGSGKSTRLPLWAAALGQKVLVVQPRRLACVALAEFLSKTVNAAVGDKIGYAIRFEQKITANTEVVFVTPGVALRWQMKGELKQFDTVILDEFHERCIDTDLLLALLKKEQRCRLIVTSATLSAARLQDYLSADLITAKGRQYPVTSQYLAQDSRAMPDLTSLRQMVFTAIEKALEFKDGNVLVFLPGRKEITQLQQQLNARYKEQVSVIPLYASVDPVMRMAALSTPATADLPRIILATNVAETSLTIPGITSVIDCGLERQTHQRNGRTVLGLQAISQASTEQRKGRAGRTQPGRVFRLWGEHAPLAAHGLPEILREELAEMMLASACCGESLAELQFIDSPKPKQLEMAALQLQQMNALDDQSKITQHGKIIFPLPIDSLFAHLISTMPTPELQGAMVDLVAALSVQQRLWQLPKEQHQLQVLQQWQPHSCDATTLILLLRSDGKLIPDEANADLTAIKEARLLARQIRQQLALPAIPKTLDFDRQQWLNAVIKAKPELCFVRRTKRRQALGNGYCEVSPARESRFAETDEAAIVFDDFAIAGKGTRQALTIASCMASVTLKQLSQADVGEIAPGNASLEKGKLWLKVDRLLANRIIEQSLIEPKGVLARQALLQLIQRNKLLPGLFDQLQIDIAGWQLWRAIDSDDFPKLDAPLINDHLLPLEIAEAAQSWLLGQLVDLEIESLEDLRLFDSADFVFPGITNWQQEKFQQNYPLRLVLAELQLKVSYQIVTKTVVIEKITGSRKKDPARWELPKWIGWKIHYRQASRLVVIK